MTTHGLRKGIRWPLALVLGCALVACHRGEQAKAGASSAPVLTVAVQPAAMRVLDEQLSVTGAVAAWQALPVSPAVNGLLVVAVNAEEGQQVSRGQVLVVLDDRSLRAQLLDASARLASARAALAKTRNPSRPQDLTTADAGVRQAQASLRDAQASYNAFRSLAAEGAVTAVDLSAKSAQLAAAQANLQTARDRASLAHVGSRVEDLSISQATVDQARAAQAQLQVQLSQTRVTAPDSGMILSRSVLLGDVAAVGKPMFTIARDRRLEMDANVAEADLPRVRVGQQVQVRSDALPGLAVTGTVREISPVLTTTNRQAVVKIDLPPQSGFKVGMFASATVRLGQLPRLAVPSDALVNREGRNQVFVVDAAHLVHAHDVQTAAGADGWVVITSGLAPGDSVVTQGVGFLKEGDLVALASPVPAESPLGDAAAAGVVPPAGASSAASPRATQGPTR